MNELSGDRQSSFRFMQDDHGPQCILRTSPSFRHHPIDITYVPVIETEHLLEAQEELIGIPLKIQFDAKVKFYFRFSHRHRMALLQFSDE